MRARTGAAPKGPAGSGPSGPAGRRPGADPARLRGLAKVFVQLFLEVEAGRRPPKAVARLMSPVLYSRLAPVWWRPGEPGQVLSVHGSLVAPGSFEAVAVVRRGRRCGAVALRLDSLAGAWRVTALARPEDGELPPAPYPFPCDDDPDDAVAVGEAAFWAPDPRLAPRHTG